MGLRRTATIVVGLTLALLVAGLPLAAPAPAAAGGFRDVPAGSQFAADVDWLVTEGIASGYRDGTFRPTAPVTRQAMALFLYRFSHPGGGTPACDPDDPGPFSDVAPSDAACGAIRWLVGVGVTSGYDGGVFKPGAAVTRQAMAQFLYRLSHGSAAAPGCTSGPFSDVAPSDAACGAISWLVGVGVTGGYAGGVFKPGAAVTRQAMAAFLHRYWQVLNADLGADVSYPQCPSSRPAGQAFGIVGVNGGKPTTWNPCRTDQLSWAAGSTGATSQPRVQLYVNTANPGAVTPRVPSWPTAGTNRYGTCTGGNDSACAYEYGRARATEDLAAVSSPPDFVWWLDVETLNSWDDTPGGTTRNVAVLEAMTETLRAAGVTTVGLYSTGYQWGVIAGSSVGPDSPLNGLPSWIAGTADVTSAWRNCTRPPLTAGGRVVLAQFIADGFDRNHPCV
ncbi:S-layer homology domain-containing protein [Geodermatophilus sp. SYSU D00703]